MFLRALRIVSPQYLDQEIEYIRKIGKDLCYPSHILDICYNKAHKKFYSVCNTQKENSKNILSLPYFNGFEAIKTLLKAFNVNLVFSYNNTLKGMLIKNGPSESKNIIYKISYSVKTGQTSNAIFIHLSENNHLINWVGSSVIARSVDVLSRNLLEYALIQLTFHCNFNVSRGLFHLDLCICNMFKNDLKDIIKDLNKN